SKIITMANQQHKIDKFAETKGRIDEANTGASYIVENNGTPAMAEKYRDAMKRGDRPAADAVKAEFAKIAAGKEATKGAREKARFDMTQALDQERLDKLVREKKEATRISPATAMGHTGWGITNNELK
ncbi:unnamed protein product, partial [marine sediment metagenome]